MKFSATLLSYRIHIQQKIQEFEKTYKFFTIFHFLSDSFFIIIFLLI